MLIKDCKIGDMIIGSRECISTPATIISLNRPKEPIELVLVGWAHPPTELPAWHRDKGGGDGLLDNTKYNYGWWIQRDDDVMVITTAIAAQALVETYGINCSKCNDFYPYAVVVDNFICYGCRH